MMLKCITTHNQHLKFNSWKKLSNTKAELEKSVAYKKSVIAALVLLAMHFK